MKIAVVDDEQFYRDRVINQLSCLGYEDVIEYESGEAFLKSDYNFDLIFLDIEMDGIDGITLSKKLRYKTCKIVFITNYSKYIKKAFGVNVDAFIDKQNLEKEISDYIENMDSIIEIKGHHISSSSIAFIEYNLKDIYITLFTSKVICIKETSMKSIEVLLDSSFHKINRKTIVNLDGVNNLNNNHFVILDKEFKVSRRLLKEFRIQLLERKLCNGNCSYSI